MTFTQQVATQVLPMAATLASGLLLALMAALGKWAMDHAKSQRVKDILGRVCGAADASVRDVSNTLVDDLRKDGVLTPEARAKLKADAEEKLRATLGAVTVDKLRTTLGFATDAEMVSFLQTQIESAVWRMKLQKSAAAAAPPVPPAAAIAPVVLLLAFLGLAFGASGCATLGPIVQACKDCVAQDGSQDLRDLEQNAGPFVEHAFMCDPTFSGAALPPCLVKALAGVVVATGPDGIRFRDCVIAKVEANKDGKQPALAVKRAKLAKARLAVGMPL